MSAQPQFIAQKQIHELTLEQYAGPEPPECCWNRQQHARRFAWEDERERHHAAVCMALENGLNVPDSVLDDYPWLRDPLSCNRWKRRYPADWEAEQ